MKPLPAAVAAVLAAVFVPTASALAQSGKPDLRLQQARTELEDSAEATVRTGADTCRQVNSPESVELLLEILDQTERRSARHLDPAHYRDIVWDALVGITDFYARKRVEAEMLQNEKNARVRQWCAELLGIYGDHSFAGTLLKGLKDKDENVVRWSARSLGLMKFPGAAGALQRLTRAKDRYIRSNALEALVRIDPATHMKSFLDALQRDKDGGVRCALLGAAPEIWPSEAESLSVAGLRDDDWRPRMQAVDNLSVIRTKSAVDALIDALDDGRPAVAVRALESLQKLTGEPIRQPHVFEQWWKDHRETFAFPAGAGKRHGVEDGRTITYNGILLTSDHVAFMLDKSYQMGDRLQSKDSTKDQAAQQELGGVLDKLAGRLTFNVFTYHTEVEALDKKPLELGKKAAHRATQFIAGKCNGRAKDIWQVLEAVIADETLDTAYLLSSGEPDVGLYVHWNRVTRHLADLNRFHKVTVHTIAYSDSQWYRDQLEKIADATGGQFQWFQ